MGNRTRFTYKPRRTPKTSNTVRKRAGGEEGSRDWQTGLIKVAIAHFLGTAKKPRTAPGSGYLTPSRFRNLCKRHGDLLPEILEALSPADRKTIDGILEGNGP